MSRSWSALYGGKTISSSEREDKTRGSRKSLKVRSLEIPMMQTREFTRSLLILVKLYKVSSPLFLTSLSISSKTIIWRPPACSKMFLSSEYTWSVCHPVGGMVFLTRSLGFRSSPETWFAIWAKTRYWVSMVSQFKCTRRQGVNPELSFSSSVPTNLTVAVFPVPVFP